MDPAQPKSSEKIFTLNQAADLLEVSVDTLLEWNDDNILKPTITQDGKIGYTEEQVSKFLAIQQISTNQKVAPHQKMYQESPIYQPVNNEQPNERSVQSPVNNQASNFYKEVSSVNKTHLTDSVQHPTNSENLNSVHEKLNTPHIDSDKFRSLGIISTISFMIIFLFVISSTQQTNSESLTSASIPSSQIKAERLDTHSMLSTTNTDNLSPTEQVHNKYTDTVNNIDASSSSNANRLAALYSLFSSNSSTSEAGTNDQIAVLPPSGLNGTSENNSDPDVDIIGIKYNTGTNYASRTNSRNSSASMFDENGNLKDDPIAFNLIDPTQVVKDNNSFVQKVAPNILVIIFTMGMFYVVFFLKRQQTFSVENMSAGHATPANFVKATRTEKVLELDQKTDGSVVIYFKGEEYKVSKPELYSETDRFIERLMGLTKDGNFRKIKYDILKDEKINLSAPLSKLVTRLGFVGIKRDLFFPRTSKNKVLFRRYLTEKDLSATGLSIERISQDLMN